jgi:hypothetical protein
VGTEEEQERLRRLSEIFAPQSYGGIERRSQKDRTAQGIVLRKKRWWWVELWFEKRELFKEAVAHVLLFAGLLGSLEVAHRLLEKSTLPADELYLLNKVHFYMYAIILVIFAFSFIIKALKSEFGKNRT